MSFNLKYVLPFFELFNIHVHECRFIAAYHVIFVYWVKLYRWPLRVWLHDPSSNKMLVMVIANML